MCLLVLEAIFLACEALTIYLAIIPVMFLLPLSLVQNDIRKNPIFRSQFHDMCAKVGVDPLASNKGFWAELLGIGDFYYELGECVSVC